MYIFKILGNYNIIIIVIKLIIQIRYDKMDI